MSSTVRLVSDGTALLSLRESDFDAYSAIGEVVDNSIQAEAKSIKIQIDYSPASREESASRIAFGDDGTGMPKEILHRCLQLGYSTRFNDRSGIGRFGVGATLGAINQCRKIEVYSREKSGDWLYTYVDLDLITGDPPAMQGIPEPVAQALPHELQSLAGRESGTLVIWSKCDRQTAKGSKLEAELSVWLGRVYRKFIWRNIEIMLNGTHVKAIDPLYVTTAGTRFPDDPPAHEYTAMSIDWPVPLSDQFRGGPKAGKIDIRFSLLPEKFRPAQGSGNSKDVKDRSIDLNNGISILRNDREVFYGEIPYWPGDHFAEIDRWWGCEISFRAELDREFTVKNIKRGAVPNKELKIAINTKMAGTRKAAIEKVRALWTQAKAQEKIKHNADVDTGHADAELVGKNTPTPKNQIDKDKVLEVEAERAAAEIEAASEAERARWQAKFSNQPFTIMDSQWKGPEFVETNHLGGNDILKYNMQHAFFDVISEIRTRLETTDGEAVDARKLSMLIDLLLMSYSKAEASFTATDLLKAETFIQQLRMMWGNYLTGYIETWRRDANEEGDGE